MVGALGHAVRAADRRLARTVVVAHVGGLLAGSLLMGGALAIIGAAAGGSSWTVAPAVVAFVLALGQALGRRPVQSRWQVPEAWRRGMDLGFLAGLYGLLLGIGVLTAVVVSAFWVFFALSIAVPPTIALGGWLAYAAARGIGFVVTARRGEAEVSAIPDLARAALIWLVLPASLLAIWAAHAAS